MFSRVSGELKSKAGASEIEAALQSMTSKINESASQRSQLERLAKTLGKDQNSSAAMNRLRIELEQVSLKLARHISGVAPWHHLMYAVQRHFSAVETTYEC